VINLLAEIEAAERAADNSAAEDPNRKFLEAEVVVQCRILFDMGNSSDMQNHYLGKQLDRLQLEKYEQI
jgi:hypothetical protein